MAGKKIFDGIDGSVGFDKSAMVSKLDSTVAAVRGVIVNVTLCGCNVGSSWIWGRMSE